jgi:acyl carrier protein
MVYNDVIECFQALGIVVEKDNFYIKDYIEDSVTYVTFIVELEQKFGVEITDEYLGTKALETMQDIVNMIECIKARELIL